MTVLVFIVLAKLAGENHVRGIAQWVRLRAASLATFLALEKPQAPHASTYSRILGQAVAIDELEQVMGNFFASQPEAGTSVVTSLDGKSVRGTVAAGQSQGLHLLAAFLPEEGWVLLQVAVGSKENEIPAAGRVLQWLGLRGKIITGDALLAQRELSLQIVQGGRRLRLDHQG